MQKQGALLNSPDKEKADESFNDMDKEKFFLEQSKYKANEDKRQGMPRTHSDIFGVVGSFRQLNFD